MEMHDNSGFVLVRFFRIGIAHESEQGTVDADGGFDDVRHIMLFGLVVIIIEHFAAGIGVLGQVKISAGGQAFHFVPAHGI
jgi:hypothetical protein